MVLGVERINARVKQPNERINFIKPLEGSHKNYAQDFLERIAAICNPIMKKHRLAVMSLEEYEYNTEFLGRNFNGGEVIQLVLKGRGGGWLPFRFVQMVMMHELAHCVQMNHSGAFWKIKNMYSDELRELWARGYTGEGLWSRGRTLLSGEYVSTEAAPEILPDHLCGGTFKTSGKRKRAGKPKLSWKEQKERRIKKKFGVDGKTLGADESVKAELEQGKKPKGKPRVAGSNRGRELRAAAALARFETKKEEPDVKDENDISTDSGSETEGDDGVKTEPGEAHDIDGSTLHDRKGRTMVKVCDDEEKDDVNVKNEMDELFQLQNVPEREQDVETESNDESAKPTSTSKSKRKSLGSLMMEFGPDAEPTPNANDKEDSSQTEGTASEAELSEESEYTKSKPKRRLVTKALPRPQVVDGSETGSDAFDNTYRKPTGSFKTPTKSQLASSKTAKVGIKGKAPLKAAGTKSRTETPEVAFNPPFGINSGPPAAASASGSCPIPILVDFPTVINCPVCTSENDINAATCTACSNVLDPNQLEGTWKCTSVVCRGSEYINAADYGVCGLCGESKPR